MREGGEGERGREREKEKEKEEEKERENERQTLREIWSWDCSSNKPPQNSKFLKRPFVLRTGTGHAMHASTAMYIQRKG
jgi:hypothetical protein